MTLREQIIADLKDAMRSGNTSKRDTLRMLDSAIKNREIEKRKRETGLDEEEILEVVSRSVKQHIDSIKQFEQGGRPELAEREKVELEILQAYLPKQMSQEEVAAVVKQMIDRLGATSASEMGKVMGSVMAELKGKADGNVVRELVAKKLGK